MECIVTSKLLSTLSIVIEMTLHNLRGAIGQTKCSFQLLVTDPYLAARDCFLQHILNSPISWDAYLRNAHNSQDTYLLKNLRVFPISGPDQFKHSFMQEYHLIGLVIKSGNQLGGWCHPTQPPPPPPKKKNLKAEAPVHTTTYYQVPVLSFQYLVLQPFFPSS